MSIERFLQGVLSLHDILDQSKKASLRVVPRVCAKFLTSRVERFDDQSDAEVKITFRAVKRTNDKIDNAEMQAIRVATFSLLSFHCFLNLDLRDELFGFLALLCN